MKGTTRLVIGAGLMGWLWSQGALGLTFPLPGAGNNVVGQVYTVNAKGGQTLGEIGREHDIGFYEMAEANPRVNANHLSYGQTIVIPAKFVLPPGKHEGLVINLAELRLYYYPRGTSEVITMPVGIGRQGWETPLATTTIIQKQKDPEWRPTARIRQNQANSGIDLPAVVPPGPNNPLGEYAMRLGLGDYLIHGTDHPILVGERASAGCIRMYPEDIEALFHQVPIGTKVRIINQPYKVGWSNGNLYLQAHLPLTEYRQAHGGNTVHIAKELVNQAVAGKSANVDWDAVEKTVKQQTGIPAVVAANPGAANYAQQEVNEQPQSSSSSNWFFSN